MLRNIPNFITILNLLTGVTGIWFVLEANPYTAALLVLLAAIFDFFDGLAARLLNMHSAIGKSLDSLADIVSFGVLPGMIVFKLLAVSLGVGAESPWESDLLISGKILLLVPLFIPAFSAIRLARFDNDDRQISEFRGLPTPANAIFIASWLGSYPVLNQQLPWLYNPWIIAVISLALSFLLITDVKMFSLKFQTFDLRSNLVRYIFLFLSLILIVFFKITGSLLSILIYILLSLYSNLKKKPAEISSLRN